MAETLAVLSIVFSLMASKGKKKQTLVKGQTSILGMFNIHRNLSTASDNVPIQPETRPEAAAAEQTSAAPGVFLCCEFRECEERALFHYLDEPSERFCGQHKFEGMVQKKQAEIKAKHTEWVVKVTVDRWLKQKKWLNFKVLEQKQVNKKVMCRGVATCKWCKVCEMDLAKFGLRCAPPFVSGYTEFTSFSARINEHDGTTDRGNKTLGASIISIPKFHKYSQAKVTSILFFFFGGG